MRHRRRRSAIVPRLVLGASFASVVPACALACGGPDPLLGGEMADVTSFGGDVAAAFDHRFLGVDVASEGFGPPPFDGVLGDAFGDADAADAPVDSPDEPSKAD